METYLQKIEGLEQWQAWAEAQEFIRVKHRKDEGNKEFVVTLSRWDVHIALESATQAMFSSPGSGAATSYVTAFGAGAGREGGAATDFVVQRPADAGQWLNELVAVSQGPMARFYQVGPWIVQVRPTDLYAHVVASTHAELAANYQAGGDTYQAMYRGSSECKDRTAVVLGFLQEQPLLGTPPEMARLVVAMCVSEAARNHRIWGINLMLLDLLRGNAVPGGWGALIQDGMHPMAKGGTFAQGTVGMKGGRVSRETWAHETGITMLWLTKYAGLDAEMMDGVGLRWRDPVKGEAYGNVVRRRIRDALVRRFGKVGWGWE